MKKQALILIGIAVVVIGGAVLLFLNGNGLPPADVGKPVDQTKLLRDTSHSAGGDLKAKVVVVEFGDYQCPACASVEPIIGQMISDYKDNPNFTFVFRNYPLPQHQNAQITAEAAEAAGEQGKFWEMHNLIYSKQNDWANSSGTLDILTGYAQSLGLDVNKFKSSVQGNKFASVISADQSDGNDLGVNSTPTFYVNGEKFTFLKGYDELPSKVNELLAPTVNLPAPK